MARELHPVVKLAKETVENYVREGKLPKPKELTPEMRERAGVFVSLHKHGQLKGCIGTFAPTRENVAEEIIANAISSSTKDPRFPPVTALSLMTSNMAWISLLNLSQSQISASLTTRNTVLSWRVA